MRQEAAHRRIAAGVAVVALEGAVDRRALHLGVKPAGDLLAKRLERRHAGAGQVRRAAEPSGDHGVFGQRLRWIEPAEFLGDAPDGGELLAANQPDARNVAVGIALPHADKDLAVLKQFEPPVGHGRSAQKERSVPSWESSNRVLLHSAGGAFTPIIGWLHCADPALAPMRRSSIGSYTAVRDIGGRKPCMGSTSAATSTANER